MSIKHKYNISLPNYVSKDFLELFELRRNYTYTQFGFSKLNNVFISNNGTLIHNLSIPLRSAENLIGFEDKTFYFTRLKMGVEQYFVCKYGKSLHSINLDDENLYFSIHTPWFGYFSWVTTYIPRLLNFMSIGIDAILLYPEEWDDIDYVKESIKLFPNLKIKKIKFDHHIFVRNYLLLPCRKWTSHFLKEDLFNVRDYFCKIECNKGFYHQNIYISRKNAKRRKILNENSILNILERYDVVSYIMEDYSYIEQICIMKNVKVVFGLHGAGLTNVNFMQSGGKVIEFTPILNDNRNFRFPFWRMSKILGLEYFALFCETTDNYEDLYESNVLIDELELQKNLNLIFEK
jgi:hypothetical protein